MPVLGDELMLMDMLGCTKKEYTTWSTVPLEQFVGCMINFDHTKMTLNISQYHLIAKTTQVFNNDSKSLINFNTPATPHKGFSRKQ